MTISPESHATLQSSFKVAFTRKFYSITAIPTSGIRVIGKQFWMEYLNIVNLNKVGMKYEFTKIFLNGSDNIYDICRLE